MEDGYTIIKELNPKINKKRFFSSMRNDLYYNQKLFGLTSSGKLVSVAAVWLLINGLNEKLFWINAFITTKKMRSKGYGKKLLLELEKYANKENFDEIRVHAHREKAILFWEDQGQFTKFSNVLKKQTCKTR